MAQSDLRRTDACSRMIMPTNSCLRLQRADDRADLLIITLSGFTNSTQTDKGIKRFLALSRSGGVTTAIEDQGEEFDERGEAGEENIFFRRFTKWMRTVKRTGIKGRYSSTRRSSLSFTTDSCTPVPSMIHEGQCDSVCMLFFHYWSVPGA